MNQLLLNCTSVDLYELGRGALAFLLSHAVQQRRVPVFFSDRFFFGPMGERGVARGRHAMARGWRLALKADVPSAIRRRRTPRCCEKKDM